MPIIDELKKAYDTSNREQRFLLLDGLTEILKGIERGMAKPYDAAMKPEQRILWVDATKLRQLIYAVKNEKKSIRKHPENDVDELWQSMEKFFESNIST